MTKLSSDQAAAAGLLRRRTALSQEIEQKHQDLRRMVSDLDVLDAAIIQFDAGYLVDPDQGKSFRTPANWLNRGDLTRLVLTVLRRAAEPMTSRDIALELLASMALDKEDSALLRVVGGRVGGTLRTLSDNGLAQKGRGPGQFNVWRLAGSL